jgi:hypothetical protein
MRDNILLRAFSYNRRPSVHALMLCLLSAGSLLNAARAEDSKKESAKKDEAKQDAEPTTKVEAGDLELAVPARWKQKPARDPRLATFEVPPAKGTEKGKGVESGEYVVFYFGGGGGSLADNKARWIGQVEAEGRKVRSYDGKCDLGDYTLIEISGTYKKSVGPPIKQETKRLENWRVINVYLKTKQGPYFLKFDGPASLVAAEMAAFRKSFGGQADSEKESAE